MDLIVMLLNQHQQERTAGVSVQQRFDLITHTHAHTPVCVCSIIKVILYIQSDRETPGASYLSY